MNENHIKYVIEALLFSYDKPLTAEQVEKLYPDLSHAKISEIFRQLQSEYQGDGRGIRIVEVAGGFQMVTAPDFSAFLKKFYNVQRKEKLSRATLESLAIIAYKQPVTKLQVQSIRGVDVDGIINNLKELGLVRITGRRKAPGRPFLYGTTRQFLEYFGLKSLGDLPKIEEFPKMEESDGVEKVTQENR